MYVTFFFHTAFTAVAFQHTLNVTIDNIDGSARLLATLKVTIKHEATAAESSYRPMNSAHLKFKIDEDGVISARYSVKSRVDYDLDKKNRRQKSNSDFTEN